MARKSRRSAGGALVPLVGLLILFRLPFVAFPCFFDSDDALNGLMGLAIQRGEFPIYYWGQGYLNTVTPALCAFFLWFIPSGQIAVKLVSLLLHGAAVWLLAMLALRAGSSLGAARGVIIAAAALPLPLAGMVMAAGSPAARNLTILCGVACWWFFRGFPGFLAGLALGLALGIGYWNEPPALLYVAPLVPLLLERASGRGGAARPPALRRWLAGAAGGAFLGLIPHLLGAAQGLARIRPGPRWHQLLEAGERLKVLLGEVLPRVLGTGANGNDIHAGTALGLAVAGLIGFLAFHAHRAAYGRSGRGLKFPVLCADALAVVFVFSWMVGPGEAGGTGRYAVFLWPSLVLWSGIGASRLVARHGVFGAWPLAAYLLLLGFSVPPYIGMARSWGVDAAPAVGLLRENGLKGGFANYWAANLITLRTREKLIVAQFTGVPLRHGKYYDILSRMDRVGYLFNRERFEEDRYMFGKVTEALGKAGSDYIIKDKGGWEVAIPLRGPLPVEILHQFRLAPGREEIRRMLEELAGGTPEPDQRSLRKASRTAR